MTRYSSTHNPRPSRARVIRELIRECEQTRGWDGTQTHPVRIWILRRALEYLQEETKPNVHPGATPSKNWCPEVTP